MTDLILAIAHHLAVFTLVAIFAAEFALLRPGLEGKRLTQLGSLDRAYGATAMRFLLRARPRHDMTGLVKTMALAEPILAGLGFGANRVAA